MVLHPSVFCDSIFVRDGRRERNNCKINNDAQKTSEKTQRDKVNRPSETFPILCAYSVFCPKTDFLNFFYENIFSHNALHGVRHDTARGSAIWCSEENRSEARGRKNTPWIHC